MRLFTLFQLGGPMMWPLILLGIVGTVLFIERTLYLHRGRIQPGPFIEGIENLLRKNRLLEALTVCEETPGPVPRIVKAALLQAEKPGADIRQTLESAAIVELPPLERRLGTLVVIARTAPLLGILGTLLALLEGFLAVQNSGLYAEAGSFSTVFIAAIASSAFGVLLALFAQLGHHFLAGRLRALVYDMEWAAQQTQQILSNFKAAK